MLTAILGLLTGAVMVGLSSIVIELRTMRQIMQREEARGQRGSE